jgi:hypothetical protein
MATLCTSKRPVAAAGASGDWVRDLTGGSPQPTIEPLKSSFAEFAIDVLELRCSRDTIRENSGFTFPHIYVGSAL